MNEYRAQTIFDAMFQAIQAEKLEARYIKIITERYGILVLKDGSERYFDFADC